MRIPAGIVGTTVGPDVQEIVISFQVLTGEGRAALGQGSLVLA